MINVLCMVHTETIVATEKGSEAVLSDAVSQLARPIIKSMFVGTYRPVCTVNIFTKTNLYYR